ncbi:MAG: hypothetical protein ACOCQR_02245 [bacterium]
MNKEIKKAVESFINNKRITHIYPQAVEKKLDFKYTRQEVENVLNIMASEDIIERIKRPMCPVCSSFLDEEEEEFECYNCVREFAADEIYYISEYKVSR